MHALRIGVQGLELLRTGRLTLPVPEPERTLLRAVRAGEVPLADVLAELDGVTRRLRTLTDASTLPAQGDTARIDSFPVRAYRSAWG